MTATRRIVQMNLHGVAPFDARRRIVFDGNAFTGQEIDVRVTGNVQTSIGRMLFASMAAED